MLPTKGPGPGQGQGAVSSFDSAIRVRAKTAQIPHGTVDGRVL